MTVRRSLIGMAASGLLFTEATAAAPLPVFAAFLQSAPGQQLLRVLSHPVVLILLLIIGFIGLVLEILTPGFGPFAVLSLLGFGLFFMTTIAVGAGVTMMPLLLFILGMVFLVIELIVPGFGLPGIAGILLIAAGVVLSFPHIAVGLQAMSAALIVTMIVVVFLVRAGMKSPLLDHIRLVMNFSDQTGYVSSSSKKEFVGQEGIAQTNLRPAGTAVFNNQSVDVITQGEYVQKGEPITAIRVEGAKIIVRRISS